MHAQTLIPRPGPNRLCVLPASILYSLSRIWISVHVMYPNSSGNIRSATSVQNPIPVALSASGQYAFAEIVQMSSCLERGGVQKVEQIDALWVNQHGDLRRLIMNAAKSLLPEHSRGYRHGREPIY
jgi:hypothetical protein